MVKFILTLMLAPLLCFANPAPFGLEIGKMTVQEFKEKYDHKYEGINKWNGGEIFSIPRKTINFEGIEKINIIFDQSKILVAVLIELPSYKFNDVLQMLKINYKLIDKDTRFGRKQFAIFSDGDVNIKLKVHTLRMNLDYTLNKFMDCMKNWKDKELKEFQQQESSQL